MDAWPRQIEALVAPMTPHVWWPPERIRFIDVDQLAVRVLPARPAASRLEPKCCAARQPQLNDALRVVQAAGRIRAEDLAQELGVSLSTACRRLRALASDGAVELVTGGGRAI